MLNSSVHRSSLRQSPSKTKLMNLLKRIAQLQLRQARYIQKIRYLQTSNLRLSNQKQQQLQLLQSYPTFEIQTLIKNLQSQIKRLSHISQEKSQREKQNWIKKFQQMTQKNNKAIEIQRQKRMELEYQVRILRQSKLSSLSYNLPNFNNTLKLDSSLEFQNQKLKKSLQQYKLKNEELQMEYNRLQSQIQTKFQMLDEQITMYQKEKEQSYNNICRLEQQLKLRQNCDGFSFSNHKQSMFNPQNKNNQDQQYDQYNRENRKHKRQSLSQNEEMNEDMNISCYKSSIASLLQQNTRLKKSISTLQQILKDNNCQIPKQIELQLNLSKMIVN